MINLQHFVKYIVQPTLNQIGLYSLSAEQLMIGTALVESGLSALWQYGNGPARGVYQMEPTTFNWLWDEFLPDKHPRVMLKIRDIVPCGEGKHLLEMLPGNLYLATAMCRVRYLAVPEPLPDAGDIGGHAYQWKKFYNTEAGKGTAQHYKKMWDDYAANYYAHPQEV